mmetsp:Transcript_55020/g.90714  ORF Transcript_55020/g.90714 Transcript_55020/m.90714 type:complete len:106 (-) Transcript_55020:2098-2415(-)
MPPDQKCSSRGSAGLLARLWRGRGVCVLGGGEERLHPLTLRPAPSSEAGPPAVHGQVSGQSWLLAAQNRRNDDTCTAVLHAMIACAFLSREGSHTAFLISPPSMP